MAAFKQKIPVRCWENPDRTTFLQEIRPLREPALLRGVAASWPSVQAAKASDEHFVRYLRALATDRPVNVVVAPPNARGRLTYNSEANGFTFSRGVSPIVPFLERILADRRKPAPYAMAMQSQPLGEVFPGMEHDHPLDLLPHAVQPRIWIGNAVHVAVHADLSENIAVNVAGRRRFTLFPPEAMKDLYIGPVELTPAGPPTGIVDVAEPDFAQHPNYRSAALLARTVELAPGDAVYIPFHWWHHVQSLDGVNALINYWWSTPAEIEIASPMDLTMLAMLTMRTLPDEQRRAFAAMLRHYVLAEGGDPGEHIPPAARGMLGAAPDRALAFAKGFAARLGAIALKE